MKRLFRTMDAKKSEDPILLLKASLAKDSHNWAWELDQLRNWIDSENNPSGIIATYFALCNVLRDIERSMYLEQIRIELMSKICLAVRQTATEFFEFYRLEFNNCNFEELSCSWESICKTKNCEQCLHHKEFRFVFVSQLFEEKIDEQKYG